MADIAAEAGISRQTLYASFSNKDELLVAVIKKLTENKLEAVDNAWSSLETVEDKLDAFLAVCVTPYFDQLRAMPDSGDLIEGFNAEGKAEIRKAEDRKTAALTSIFLPYSDELQKSGTTAEALAGLVVSAATSFIFTARDHRHLETLLRSLKLAVLCQLGIKPSIKP